MTGSLRPVLFLLIAVLSAEATEPGLSYLMWFPDARAVGSGRTGAADDQPWGMFYNPAALAGTSRIAAAWSHSGLFSGGDYDLLSAGYRLRKLVIGASALRVGYGEIEWWGGDSLVIFEPVDAGASVSAAYFVRPGLAVGTAGKMLWYSYQPFQGPRLNAFALDVGARFYPGQTIGLGASLQNLGVAFPHFPGDTALLPFLFRLGAAVEPKLRGPFELRLVADAWRELVSGYAAGGFLDKWEDVNKSIGLRLRVARMVNLRIGYYEELPGTGGIIVSDGDNKENISLLRFLAGKYDGRFQWVGFCCGVGLEYRGLAVDVGSEGHVLDYSRHTVGPLRILLSCNLPAELGRD